MKDICQKRHKRIAKVKCIEKLRTVEHTHCSYRNNLYYSYFGGGFSQLIFMCKTNVFLYLKFEHIVKES